MDNPIAVFWSRVTKSDGCWEWNGARHKGKCAYGSFRPGGIYKASHSYAHRFSWIIHRGKIPDGLWVLHKCDNPPCVNPQHLFLGTAADNVRDASMKGRMTHKLSDAEVAEIRALRARGIPTENIRQMYGVSSGHISSIVRGVARINTAAALTLPEMPPEVEARPSGPVPQMLPKWRYAWSL